MAASSGSPYQAIRLKHIANTPPNCDPIRSNENGTMYFTRMAAQGLLPDIDADESDSDYAIRLATYVVNPPVESISAIYSVSAGTEISPTATGSYALKSFSSSYAPVAPAYSASVSTQFGTKQASLVTANTYTITSSWATNAVNSAPSSTASYLEGGKAVLSGITGDNITITNTSGRCIDARCSTSGNTIYAQSIVSQAVAAAQVTTALTSDINVGALTALRSIVDFNGGVPNAAILTVTDQYATGSSPMITCTKGSTEVFKVDSTGSLSCSGSRGYTGKIVTPCTLSFQGGIVTGWTA